MSYVVVAAELCKDCGLCVSGLPQGLPGALPGAESLRRLPDADARGRECTGCTMCAVMCPDTAIEVYRSVADKPSQEKTPA